MFNIYSAYIVKNLKSNATICSNIFEQNLIIPKIFNLINKHFVYSLRLHITGNDEMLWISEVTQENARDR